MMIRYYLHSDQIEDQGGGYYCALCDLFVDDEHFEKNIHSSSNKERYDRSVKDWKILKSNHANKYSRPNYTNNLFSHIPKQTKPIKSPFYRWLNKQKKRDDPIGDLSGDIQRDSKFPVNSSSLDLLKDHLISKSACSEAIQALEEAHIEFKSKNAVRSGLTLSLRFNIFRRDEYQCQICGVTASSGSRLEVDHKVPVAKGGSDDESNLWTLCFECNRGKGAKDL